MTLEEMKSLKCGDLIRSQFNGLGYFIVANCGDRLTACRIADVTNPSEWDIVSIAAYREPEKRGTG